MSPPTQPPGEAETMPNGERREHRRFWRFDPTVSTGALIQIGVVIVGLFAAWGTYQADRTTIRLQIEMIQANASADKQLVKEQALELKNQLTKVQDTITQVDKSVIEIRAEMKSVQRVGR